MRRPTRSLLGLAILVVASLVTPLPAVAAPTQISLGSAPEYFTDVRHDALDFDQSTDMITDPHLAQGTVADNPQTQQGSVGFTVRAGSGNDEWKVPPLWMAFPHTVDESASRWPDDDPGALPDQYDGVTNPVDADRYRAVSARFWIEASPGGAAPKRMYLDWYTCQEIVSACRGRMWIDDLSPGWNTVVLPIELTAGALANAKQEWAGPVHAVTLGGPRGDQFRFRLDWFRLFEPGVQIAQIPGSASEPGYTSATSSPFTRNGESTSPVFGSLPIATIGEDTYGVDVGALPEGTWTIYEDSRVDARVTVQSRPRPQVLQPDRAGGDDFATAQLRNPWDFEDADDFVRVANSTGVQLEGGELSAVNVTNDPYVVLPLGDEGLDPVHYHRVTVDQHYDAPFNLDDSDDGGRGGSHGRLIWRTNNHPASGCRSHSDGREMVFYKARDYYEYVLGDIPPEQVTGNAAEPNLGSTSCGVSDLDWDEHGTIRFLRFDPHEAPMNYRWYLRELRIAADDAADPTFEVTWRDQDAPIGTRMTVRLDDDREGFDGELLGRVTKQGGQSEFALTFDATERLPATYWVSVRSVAPDGTVGEDYSTGPVTVSPRIAGPDRIATAVELSRQSFDRADTAVIASARDFPDALVAVQLADATGAPLLLTSPDSLDQRVAAELQRLGVSRVYVAGGDKAVSPAVERALGNRTVTRLGGTDRYETAARIAREAIAIRGREPAEVAVATGGDFPDALAAGPWIGYSDTALVLARPEPPPPPPPPADPDDPDAEPEPPPPPPAPDNTPAKELVADLGAPVVVLGGVNAVSGPVAQDIADGNPVRRIAGKDRFETGHRLATAAVRAGGDDRDLLIATGRTFPDALAAGPAALARGGVLLLTERRSMPPATRAWLQDTPNATAFRVVGGYFAVTHQMVRRLAAAAGA